MCYSKTTGQWLISYPTVSSLVVYRDRTFGRKESWRHALKNLALIR